jgi:hypothetical protein
LRRQVRAPPRAWAAVESSFCQPAGPAETFADSAFPTSVAVSLAATVASALKSLAPGRPSLPSLFRVLPVPPVQEYPSARKALVAAEWFAKEESSDAQELI